jgi:hypothetical protein
MAGSSGSLHENESALEPETIDRHRAVVSIMEELEAVDWYDQWAVRNCARAALLHGAHPQHDTRLSHHQSRPRIARWSDRLGAGGGRRSRDESARWRLRADRGAGFFRRLPRSHEHVGAAVPAGDVHVPGADAASVGSSYIPRGRCEIELSFITLIKVTPPLSSRRCRHSAEVDAGGKVFERDGIRSSQRQRAPEHDIGSLLARSA